MTLSPVIPLWALVVVGVVLAAFALWRLAVEFGSETRVAWILRLVMVLLLVVIALRPSIPGTDTGPAAVGGLEVYFVIDTTSSMVAEDYGPVDADPPGTRLDGVKSDIESITDALVGAQFSLTTFDSTTVQRVPLTSDATAVASATSVLTQEVTYYSRGSTIDAPLQFMTRLLQDAQTKHPDRRRVMFYFGDGEQTRNQDPESFAPLASFISGGAVLGYGTTAGGIMKTFDGYGADGADGITSPTYIMDPETLQRAKSIYNEANLQTIASQLSVSYDHRLDGDSITPVVSGIDIGDVTVRAGTVTGPFEFYWIFAIPLGLLALREVISVGQAVAETRPRRGKRL